MLKLLLWGGNATTIRQRTVLQHYVKRMLDSGHMCLPAKEIMHTETKICLLLKGKIKINPQN